MVVITGATSGAGPATARAFAAKGASIALLAQEDGGLDATRRELKSKGARVLAMQADVADAYAVERAASKIERKLGPIDVWVNNALTPVLAPAAELEPVQFRRLTELTYLATVFGTLAALQRMQPRDAGVIVQVGSAPAYRDIPLNSAYCGAKHAIQGYTEALRAELEHQHSGVRVTMVKLPAQPEMAADAIVAAAEHPGHREWFGAGSTALVVAANKLSLDARARGSRVKRWASRHRRALTAAGAAGALAAGGLAAAGRRLRR